MDDFDVLDWVVEGPYGDQLCQCPCGHRAELMPEETGDGTTDLCLSCLQGRHEQPPAP